MTHINLCLNQYQPSYLKHWKNFEKKIKNQIEVAQCHQSNFFLMPEYAGLELTQWFQGSDLEKFIALQSILSDYLEFFQTLAKQYKIYIQPDTIVVAEENTKYFFNRAYFFSPSGKIAYQDKCLLTNYEKEFQYLKTGKSLSLFQTQFGLCAIAICYDSEFPILVHQAIKQGIKFLMIPSCTDHETGYYRVSISARARAIENHCFVANTYLVGNFKRCHFIDKNLGKSAVFTPADYGFPHDGILVQSKIKKADLITASIDLKSLEKIYSVNNRKDMTCSETIFPSDLFDLR